MIRAKPLFQVLNISDFGSWSEICFEIPKFGRNSDISPIFFNHPILSDISIHVTFTSEINHIKLVYVIISDFFFCFYNDKKILYNMQMINTLFLFYSLKTCKCSVVIWPQQNKLTASGHIHVISGFRADPKYVPGKSLIQIQPSDTVRNYNPR